MGIIAKLTGRQSSDAGTAKWLAGPTGGRGTRKGR